MADDSGLIVIGQSRDGGTPADVALRLDRANRHGLVAGATGTGKTVTLQVMAEAFSRAGVPVFAADVKGDLSGIGAPATLSPKLTERAQALGVTLSPAAAPTILWDLLGAGGHPVRTTVSELGPLLLARLLDLTEVQEGVLAIAFQLADDEGLLLLDLDDLQAVLAHLADDPKAVGTKYGNVSSASVGAIQRRLLQLRQQGAAHLFGEPALDLSDLMRVGGDGRGWVSLLVADKLMSTPALYAVFLLWLMSELFEQLPEVGDPDKPKLVLFFDEAHLLFTDAPKALLAKIEQVVRLVRSKGVGLYFVTQSPADVPDTVLAQLGTRIEHALRAYTPAEQDALNAAARSFRANPAFDTAAAIQALGVGEALVSSLDERGAPTMVARTSIRPPNSRIGPLTPAERTQILAASPVKGVYDETVNRESAAERLRARTDQTAAPSPQSPVQTSAPAPAPAPSAPRATPPGRSYQRQTATEAAAMSLVRSVSSAVGSQLGRAIIRGVLGSLTRR